MRSSHACATMFSHKNGTLSIQPVLGCCWSCNIDHPEYRFVDATTACKIKQKIIKFSWICANRLIESACKRFNHGSSIFFSSFNFLSNAHQPLRSCDHYSAEGMNHVVDPLRWSVNRVFARLSRLIKFFFFFFLNLACWPLSICFLNQSNRFVAYLE